MMLNDLKYYLQDDILLLTDKMTMANSIECRVPFLDHELVEYVLSLPDKFKNSKRLRLVNKSLMSDLFKSI